LTYENREINLIKDNFDLAIINHRPLKSSQKMRLLCRTKIIFYCYPEYIKKFGLPVKQEQIKDHPIIGIPLDNEVVDKKIYLINKKTGQREIFNSKYRIIQNSSIHDQELTQTGVMIGAGMDIMMKNDIEAGLVVQVLPDSYIPGFDYYLLINPEGKNARTEIFIDFINKCMLRLNLDENLVMH
jgi:hypothetical protein